jgi:hypothetical protein
MPLRKICQKCGNKFFIGSGDYNYCRTCLKENPNIEQQELARILVEKGLVKWHGILRYVSEVGIPKDYLPNEVMQRIQNDVQRNLPQTFTEKDFASGKETVVLLVEGDAALKVATMIANNCGYELLNVSSAQSPWSPFTKYTLIFKKTALPGPKIIDRS